MKKILLAAAAALAMVSCSQNEIDGIDNGKQDARNEIKFGYTPVTRANPITTDDFSSFIINAYEGVDASTDFASANKQIITNGGFTKPQNGNWTADGGKKYYWPVSEYAHFFGHNSTLEEPAGTKAAIYDATTYPSITYTVASTVANQEDFLVAKSIHTQKVNPLTLDFKHALTQIAFKLKGDDSDLTYTVSKITIKNVCNKNTYNYDTESWGSTPEGSASYDLIPSSNVIVTGTTETAFASKDGVAILMPQNVDNKEIEITYTAKYTADNTEVAVNSPATVKLSGAWTKGKTTTYTLALSAAKISISGTADTEWTPETGTTQK